MSVPVVIYLRISNIERAAREGVEGAPPFIEVLEPTTTEEAELSADVKKANRLFDIAGVKPAQEITHITRLEGGRPQPIGFQLKWLAKDPGTFIAFSLSDAGRISYYDLNESPRPRETRSDEHVELVCNQFGVSPHLDFSEIESDMAKLPIPAEARWELTLIHEPNTCHMIHIQNYWPDLP